MADTETERRPLGATATVASILVVLVVVVEAVQTAGQISWRGEVPPVAAVFLLGVRPLAWLVAGIAVIVWLWRARSNVEAGGQQRLARGWVIGGWFCPVVCFWFPYQLVIDVWRASAPQDQRGGAENVVMAWWLIYVVSWVLSFTVGRAADDAPDLAVFLVLVDVAAAALLVVIVNRITRWQSVGAR